jgi:hypothetical protein
MSGLDVQHVLVALSVTGALAYLAHALVLAPMRATTRAKSRPDVPTSRLVRKARGATTTNTPPSPPCCGS